MKASISAIVLILALIMPSYFFGMAFAAERHIHDPTTSTIATLVGVASLITSMLVISRMIPARKQSESYLVLLLSLGAGIIHVMLGPAHYTQVGAEHGLFFFTIGTYQIMFGLLYFISKRLTKITITILIGSIILYAITRIEGITEPFVAPEGVDTTGIITKIIEALLVIVLIKQIILKKEKTEVTI